MSYMGFFFQDELYEFSELYEFRFTRVHKEFYSQTIRSDHIKASRLYSVETRHIS